jgi:flagellar hook-associated protein 2
MNMQGIRTNVVDENHLSSIGIEVFQDGSYGALYTNIGVSIDGTSRTLLIDPKDILGLYESGLDHTLAYRGGDGVGGPVTGDIKNSYMSLVMGRGDNGNLYVDTTFGFQRIDDAFLNSIVGGTYDPTNSAHRDKVRELFDNGAIYTAENAVYANFAKGVIEGADGGTGPYYVQDGTNYTQITQQYIDDILANAGNPVTQADKEAAIAAHFENKAIYEDHATTDTRPLAEKYAELLNRRIEDQFGSDYANIVSVTSDNRLLFNKQGSNVTLFEQTGFHTLELLGLGGGASTSGAVNNKKLTELPGLGNMFAGAKEVTIRINDVNIKLSDTDTVKTMMDKINGSEAGVTLSYSSATDSFTLASKLEGTANNMKDITGDAANIFQALGIGTVRADGTLEDGSGNDGVHTKAQNFIGIINGEEYIRQSNTFTHEGMTYSFNQTFNATLDSNGKAVVTDPSESIKIEVTKNTADIITGIKGFVEEYNKLVTHLNDLIKGQRVYRKGSGLEYPPLTDDERKAMSKEEAALYDEKAKQGILANDSELRKLLNEMRSAIYQKVDGVNLTMAEIGITTGANYSDGGLLVIDEEKLKKAIENNYDGVVSLFTKSSSVPVSDKANAGKRYSESGIAQRLNDIFNNAAGTTAVSGVTGEKGYLVTKAGIPNDKTYADNPMTKQIDKYDEKIDQLLAKWYRQEETYYMMFARMETAMSKLQSQQNSLAQIMAAGGK